MKKEYLLAEENRLEIMILIQWSMLEMMYRAVVTVPANSASHYTYINGGWWDAKENIGGQGCSNPYAWNDRF